MIVHLFLLKAPENLSLYQENDFLLCDSWHLVCIVLHLEWLTFIGTYGDADLYKEWIG